ncbi:MAG: hypothetical protein LLF94_09310 [Chlamydiales bacterium]|nr:hypothetical protein [Chlamydiales bacterium]
MAFRFSLVELYLQNRLETHRQEVAHKETLLELKEKRAKISQEIDSLVKDHPCCLYHSLSSAGQQHDALMEQFNSLSQQINQISYKLNVIGNVKEVETAMKLSGDDIAKTPYHHLTKYKSSLKRYQAALSSCSYSLISNRPSLTNALGALKQQIQAVDTRLLQVSS